MFEALNESHRLSYLNALGVCSWLPKKPLAGSNNNQCLWQDAELVLEDAKSDGFAEPLQRPEPKTSIVGLAGQNPVEAIKEAIQTSSDLTQPEPVTVQNRESIDHDHSPRAVAAEAQQSERLAPLHLGISWYKNGVLVITDVPVQEGAAMSSPIQRLQTAIVNASNLGGSAEELEVMPLSALEFNWPLVPGPHADHSLIGAQSGLMYSLSKLLKDKTCNTLMAMGPSAMKLIKPEAGFGLQDPIELCGHQVKLVCSHSLHQLLAVPSLKKETWNHVKSLLEARKAS
jgi:hypothetical protein